MLDITGEQTQRLTYKELLDREKILRPSLFHWPKFLQESDLYRERRINPRYQGEVVLLYVIIPKSALSKEQKREASESLFTRFDTNILPVDLRSIFQGKTNSNVAICGSSGGGKSRLSREVLKLFKHEQVIALSFKPNDEALKVGIPKVDALSTFPNIFADADAFSQAYLTTFLEGVRAGIQLQATAWLLAEIVIETNSSNDKSWKKFFEVLEAMKKKVTKNQQETLANIELNARQLVTESVLTPVEINNKQSVVLDFSNLQNTQAKTFHAELALRQLWSDIERGRRNNITICIDEAHRVTKQEHSIIHIMSKEIRHRGRLIVVTQALSEVKEQSLQNIGTILCTRTGTADLQIVRAINPILHHAVSQLSAYEFIDIQFPRFSEYVPVFKFEPPAIEIEYEPFELTSRAESKAESKPQLTEEIRKQHQEAGGDGAAEEREEQKVKEKLVIAEEELTSLFPAYQKDVISAIAEKHKDVPFNDVKFSVSLTLKKLINSGVAGTIRLEEFEGQTAFSFCYLRGRNVSSLHSYIQEKTRDAIGRIYKIIHYATSGEFSNPDIETASLDFEIETSLGNRTTSLEKRITATLKEKPAKSIVIVVPNEDQEARYTKLLLSFLKEYPDRLSIMTLRELKEWIKELQSKDAAKDTEAQEDENRTRGANDTEKLGQDGESENG